MCNSLEAGVAPGTPSSSVRGAGMSIKIRLLIYLLLWASATSILLGSLVCSSHVIASARGFSVELSDSGVIVSYFRPPIMPSGIFYEKIIPSHLSFRVFPKISSGSQYTQVQFPLVLLIAISVIILILIIQRIIELTVKRSSHCEKCGYCCDGLSHSKCPECGHKPSRPLKNSS